MKTLSRIRSRGGQSSVETMLFTSVIVVAVVGAGWMLAGGGIVDGLKKFGEGAETAWVDPSKSP